MFSVFSIVVRSKKKKSFFIHETSRIKMQLLQKNPFLANVPISNPLKTPENLFRGHQMGKMTINGLKALLPASTHNVRFP